MPQIVLLALLQTKRFSFALAGVTCICTISSTMWNHAAQAKMAETYFHCFLKQKHHTKNKLVFAYENLHSVLEKYLDVGILLRKGSHWLLLLFL